MVVGQAYPNLQHRGRGEFQIEVFFEENTEMALLMFMRNSARACGSSMGDSVDACTWNFNKQMITIILGRQDVRAPEVMWWGQIANGLENEDSVR